MEIHELVIEMKLLERRLTLYEEKYGILSEDFYTALILQPQVRFRFARRATTQGRAIMTELRLPALHAPPYRPGQP